MPTSRRRVLIAGLPPLMRDVRKALAADCVTISVKDFVEAQKLLNEERLDCVVVAYHFDQLQTVQLIRYVKETPALSALPIILLAVLEYNFGGKEKDIHSAYLDLGVHSFINLFEEIRHHGRDAAMARLRATVMEATNGDRRSA